MDLALKGDRVIPQSVTDKLNIAFGASLLPYKVDVIDLNNIDEEFYNAIKNNLYRIM